MGSGPARCFEVSCRRYEIGTQSSIFGVRGPGSSSRALLQGGANLTLVSTLPPEPATVWLLPMREGRASGVQGSRIYVVRALGSLSGSSNSKTSVAGLCPAGVGALVRDVVGERARNAVDKESRPRARGPGEERACCWACDGSPRMLVFVLRTGAWEHRRQSQVESYDNRPASPGLDWGAGRTLPLGKGLPGRGPTHTRSCMLAVNWLPNSTGGQTRGRQTMHVRRWILWVLTLSCTPEGLPDCTVLLASVDSPRQWRLRVSGSFGGSVYEIRARRNSMHASVFGVSSDLPAAKRCDRRRWCIPARFPRKMR